MYLKKFNRGVGEGEYEVGEVICLGSCNCKNYVTPIQISDYKPRFLLLCVCVFYPINYINIYATYVSVVNAFDLQFLRCGF